MPDAEISNPEVCAYCAVVLDGARFSLEINAWGVNDAYGYADPSFCTREHMTSYFGEDRLPLIEISDLERQRVGVLNGAATAVGVSILLLGTVGFWVIGVVSWFRWIWS